MLRWPDATLYGGLSDVADRAPDATALVAPGGTTTYGALLRESRALADGFADLGVGTGDRVAVWLGNRPAWIRAQLAASYLGAAVVAVNTRYRSGELAHLLADAGPKVLVTESSFADRDYLRTVADLAPGLTSRSPAGFDPDDYPLAAVVAPEADDRYPAVRSLDDVVGDPDAPAAGHPAEDPTAPACVFYTSGTTGDPKGCLQTNRSLLNHSHRVGEHLGVDGEDVALGALPFPGVMGHNTFLSALTHGIPLVLQRRFRPGQAIDLVEDHGVTYFSAIGEMYVRMVDHDEFAPERVAGLERGAVAFVSGVDEATFRRVEEAVGFPLVRPYGLSEANSQVLVGVPSDPVERRLACGGPPIHPEERARVVDPETGDRLPPGERGELLLKGFNVMAGYLGRETATREAIDDDGWLHTGDLCSRTDDGYYRFHARLDDALRVRGFLVAPDEIEAAIEDHDDVDRAQVVGVSHPRHGQVPYAFVTPAGEGEPDPDGIRSWVAGRIADYKVPERVVAVDGFPRTDGPHGRKIRKSALRDRARRLREEG